MKIYHGSTSAIEKPKYKGSNYQNDYGPAFYMTVDLEAAKIWACRHNVVGVVNVYDVDTRIFNNLKVLDLTDKSKYSVLNWLAILMHFRALRSTYEKENSLVLNWLSQYYINVNEYDVVIGYRADDNYFKFPLNFLNGRISLDDLENVFLMGNLGIQYAFISERSIRVLHFEKYLECDDLYLSEYYKIVTKASEEVAKLVNQPLNPNKTYIMDILRRKDER